MIIIFINAIIESFIGVYAEPFAKAFIVLIFPQIYMYMIIFNHSYFRYNQKTNKLILLYSILTLSFLFLIIFSFYLHGPYYILNKDGLLSSGKVSSIYAFLVFGLTPVTYEIRKNLEI